MHKVIKRRTLNKLLNQYSYKVINNENGTELNSKIQITFRGSYKEYIYLYWITQDNGKIESFGKVPFELLGNGIEIIEWGNEFPSSATNALRAMYDYILFIQRKHAKHRKQRTKGTNKFRMFFMKFK